MGCINKENEMKKVLILAYDFPPYVSVGGLRPHYWMKNFHKHGIYPIVVTREWGEQTDKPEINYISPSGTIDANVEVTEEYTLVKTPYRPNFANRIMLRYGQHRYRIVRKSLSFMNEMLQFLLPIGTKRSIYVAANEYLNSHKVDYIIATGDPFVLFHYANKLSKKHAIPWIADYRDPWSQDLSLKGRPLLKWIYGIIEQGIVKNAKHISVANEHFKELLLFKFKEKQVHVISNGFNIENTDEPQDQQSEVLTISFVGTLYAWHPIERFLSALEQVIENSNAHILLKLYGINNPDEIRSLIKSKYYKIEKHIHIIPRMTNQLLLQELQKDNVMLLFNYYSLPGTKIYDYLSVRRKILLCFTDDMEANKLRDKFLPVEIIHSPKNPQIEIVEKTKGGIVVKDYDNLIFELRKLVLEFEKKGCIECNSEGIEQYSRAHQLKSLASLLHTISKEVQEKKVLILAYDFPPYVSVAGLRPHYWMNNFHKHGIRPVVVTRQWGKQSSNQALNYVSPSETQAVEVINEENYTLIHAPFKPNFGNRIMLKYGENRFRIIRKFFTLSNELLQYALPLGTKRTIFEAAKHYLKDNKVDCIIATGDPFVLFHYGNQLSKKFKTPWIADYRDPWSQDLSLVDSVVLKSIYSHLESKIVRAASIITTVDKYCLDLLKNKFNTKKMLIIRNGYDTDLLELEEKQQKNRLSIAFIGTIYKWHPLEAFLKAFQTASELTNFNFQLKFYGVNNEDSLKDLIASKFESLTSFVTIIPKMSNSDLICALKKENLMLLYNSYSITGTKIFDYIGIKRKILFCFTEDADAEELKSKYFFKENALQKDLRPQIEILEHTQSGILVKNKNELTKILVELNQEFELTGEISCDSKHVEEYSRSRQLEILVKEINTLKKYEHSRK
jgi:hypothetical protein